MTRIAFMLVVERGDLEGKSRLLVESIRAFGGEFSDSSIWAVQPRPGKAPSRRTLDALADAGVSFLRADLNRAWKDYPLANKPSAAAFLEALLASSVNTLVLLDSDMIFLAPPSDLLLDGSQVAALRPVDEVLVGSPSDRQISAYWSYLYRMCKVSPNSVWTVKSSVDQTRIRAYFNSGLVAVRPHAGLFRAWQENLDRIARDHAWRHVARSRQERWFLEQASLAATLLAETSTEQVRLLSKLYGYPLHKHNALPAEQRVSSLSDAVVVHYHREFYARRWRQYIRIGDSHARWLQERLPLPSFWTRIKYSPSFRSVLGRSFKATASIVNAVLARQS